MRASRDSRYPAHQTVRKLPVFRSRNVAAITLGADRCPSHPRKHKKPTPWLGSAHRVLSARFRVAAAGSSGAVVGVPAAGQDLFQGVEGSRGRAVRYASVRRGSGGGGRDRLCGNDPGPFPREPALRTRRPPQRGRGTSRITRLSPSDEWLWKVAARSLHEPRRWCDSRGGVIPQSANIGPKLRPPSPLVER